MTSAARTCAQRAAVLAALVLAGALCAAGAPAPRQAEKGPADLLAPGGIPFDNEESYRLMQMKPLSANVLANGSFELGRYWPLGWEPTDGLTTFWIAGGTDGARAIRIFTDVLDAQWTAREKEVNAALDAARRRSNGDPQSLPADPIPPPPERLPTSPPYYNTVAGLHGVHYRSDYVKVVPGAVYRFCVDARTEAEGEPKAFIKSFYDQTMQTSEGVRTVRRDAYVAQMNLDPCDKQWRCYARLLHPWESKATLAGGPLKPEWLQVQLYAYWKPGSYCFDNARLEIVGMQEAEPGPPAPKPAPPAAAAPPDRGAEEDQFPVFEP